MDKKIRILAISGSLRSNSSNNAVLRVAAKAIPENVSFEIFENIGILPHFDDSKVPDEAVQLFRKSLMDADGVMICSPEYAFGVPGSLKNALDWTVSSGEFVNKPTALITAATGGDKAHAALQLTFTALSANMPDDCKLLISFVRSKMSSDGQINNEETIAAINSVLYALIATIKNEKSMAAIQA